MNFIQLRNSKRRIFNWEENIEESDGQFAISVWIFIDDWNYKYGEEKLFYEK